MASAVALFGGPLLTTAAALVEGTVTALLPRHGVSWTAIDDAHALATITAGGTTLSLEFRFDAEGRNVSVFAPIGSMTTAEASP